MTSLLGARAGLPTPRAGQDDRPLVLPASPPQPTATIPPQLPRHLRGIPVTYDGNGRPQLGITIGQHAAGTTTGPATIPTPPTGPAPTEQLVADLTAAMQGYAAHAQLTTYADLIPFLAKSLVCNGWVE